MGGRNEGGIMNVPCIGHYQFRNDTYSQPKILLYTPLSLPPLLPPLSPSLPSPSFAAPFAAPLVPAPHLRAPAPPRPFRADRGCNKVSQPPPFPWPPHLHTPPFRSCAVTSLPSFSPLH